MLAVLTKLMHPRRGLRVFVAFDGKRHRKSYDKALSEPENHLAALREALGKSTRKLPIAIASGRLDGTTWAHVLTYPVQQGKISEHLNEVCKKLLKKN